MSPNEDAVYKMEWLRQTLAPSIVVLDGVTEAFALHGWNINAAEDAARFQKVFGRFDAASISIDHAGKDAERCQVGSQHKRAGLDGAQYEFKALRREGRDGHSIAAVRVTKDRHGSVREFAPDGYIGTIHVADDVWIKAPMPTEAADQLKKLNVLDWITANPGQSGTDVAKGVGMSKTDGLALLKEMEVDGYLRSEKGTGQAWRARYWFDGEQAGSLRQDQVDLDSGSEGGSPEAT